MITAITPTGDRLHQFEICYELMMRQTVKPDRWVIVDDGVQKLQNTVDQNIDNIEIIVIQREPDPYKITLKENLLAALDKIEINDKIIFFEDDDFYPVTYIEAMSQLLDDYHVVGGLLRKYYNLNFKGYWEFKRPMFGTLNSTAFCASEKTLNILHEICINGDVLKIDIDFWREIKSGDIPNFLHSDPMAQVIGIKGWHIGRKGIVEGTHTRNRKRYLYDANYAMLNYYFGDFSEKYKSFIPRGFMIDLWRPFIGAVYKFRAFLKAQENNLS